VSTNSPWISGPSNVESGVRKVIEQFSGYQVNVVSNLPDLKQLVYYPPNNLFVINAHGEAFPIRKKIKALNFINRLADNISKKGLPKTYWNWRKEIWLNA